MCIKMKRTVILTVAIFFTVEALDCGIHLNKNELMVATIHKCVSSNKTLEDIWDMGPTSSESDSSSEEDSTVDGKMLQNFRTRRAIVRTDPKMDLVSQDNDTDQTSAQSEEPVAENCIIQCIFEHLEMTDTVGYPAHNKILEGLLQNATNRELRDFLQDTTDECFQEMDKEVTMDPCSYSIKLVTCLSEKGKSNCADWPVGDLPLNQ